ncbi:23S rRNA pseudouridine(2604) synthase RluF [Tenacibaculum maritimum]|uniref:23S rRNA pseudouridine(2604) synthase RluF n=1 Tax=Tenacibaculum maritimum TaxID=107401 RepID=UPI0023082860|nr:23S rRNA pseudouridine(2604) synthase RluF [Tenacibaculum maritimum]MDB0603374.1 23S rRNA pseudouridine(2604) synthase RluF [Tenacibaculum maritimum]MDB0613065.1 23S rRNA pseudouridine(2604) synthase RluF [Tenacibaculum maritimum]
MEKNNQNSINLNKYISSTGVCSRRDAEKLIIEGRVFINGERAKLGNRVFDGDRVTLDGRVLKSKPTTLYIAFNKPIGIVCTTDSKERKNIVRYINHSERLFPIGRLDKPSQGLIFLTNDGDIVNKILRAGNNHEKEYIVSVNKKITSDFIKRMRGGIPILGTVTKKCKVIPLNDFTFKIILVQGLNRQIRRMCEYLGYEVTRLKRERIMNVTLDNLAVGDWRELTEEELKGINKMIATSSKTEEASRDAHKKVKKTPKKQKEEVKATPFNKKSTSFRKNSKTSKRNSKFPRNKKR